MVELQYEAVQGTLSEVLFTSDACSLMIVHMFLLRVGCRRDVLRVDVPGPQVSLLSTQPAVLHILSITFNSHCLSIT